MKVLEENVRPEQGGGKLVQNPFQVYTKYSLIDLFSMDESGNGKFEWNSAPNGKNGFAHTEAVRGKE